MVTVHLTNGQTVTLTEDGHSVIEMSGGGLHLYRNDALAAVFAKGAWSGYVEHNGEDPYPTVQVETGFAPPPDPGEGWRLLGQDEIQEDGDEYWCDGEWDPAVSVGERVSDFAPYANTVRRRIRDLTVGYYAYLYSKVIRDYVDGHPAKKNVDILIEIDGEKREFNLEDFKRRLGFWHRVPRCCA